MEEKTKLKPAIVGAVREINEDGIEILRLVAPVMGEEALQHYDKLVDEKIANTVKDYLPLDGSKSMTGDFDLDGNFISLYKLEGWEYGIAFNQPEKAIWFTRRTLNSSGGYSYFSVTKINISTATASNGLDMAGLAIKNVKDPVADKDVANKSYVDSSGATLEGSLTTLIESKVDEVNDTVETLNDKHDSDINSLTTTLTSTKNELAQTIDSNKTVLETKLETAVTEITGRIDGLPTTTDLENAIATAMTSVYKYKGSVATEADLPSGYGAEEAGWIYNVEEDGMNWAWDGEKWDSLGTQVVELPIISFDTYQSILDGKELNSDRSNDIINALAYKALYDKVKGIIASDIADVIESYTIADNEIRSDITDAYTAADDKLKEMIQDIANNGGGSGGSGGVDFTTDDTLILSDKVLSVAVPTNPAILTQEEYNALPEDKKKKGLYLIKGSSIASIDDLFKAVQEAGYTGTREEFLSFLASFANFPPDKVIGQSRYGVEQPEINGATTVVGASGAEVFNNYLAPVWPSNNVYLTTGNVASGTYAHAEGSANYAKGQYSHAEGYQTLAKASKSHTEGYRTYSYGEACHAEGYGSFCTGLRGCHVEGLACMASGMNSLFRTSSYSGNIITFDMKYVTSTMMSSISVGMYAYIWNMYYSNSTPDRYKIAEIDATNFSITLERDLPTSSFTMYFVVIFDAESSSNGSYGIHAEGIKTIAIGYGAHAEGNNTFAYGNSAHSEGNNCKALAVYTHAGGINSNANNTGAFVHGSYLDSYSSYQAVFGIYNKTASGLGQLQQVMVVGAGTGTARANCFRTGNDGSFGVGAWNASGADYAEMFEWADGNLSRQDRVGLFVTLDGDKIKIAKPGDYILGVVSGNPSVVGNMYDDQWQGMYVTDIFGRVLTEEVEIPDEYETVVTKNDDGTETEEKILVTPAHKEIRQKINPNYDHTQEYKGRRSRSEWSAVGMVGRLIMIDDGSCKVNEYAKCGEGGIATYSESQTRFRVAKRLDESHIMIIML